MARIVVDGVNILQSNAPKARAQYSSDKSLPLIGRLVNATAIEFVDGDTTPNVQDGNLFTTNNTSSTVYTDFDNGAENQVISIRVDDDFSEFANNANISIPGGVNLEAEQGDFLEFRLEGGVWYLKSVPSGAKGDFSFSEFLTDFSDTDETPPDNDTLTTGHPIAIFPDGASRETAGTWSTRTNVAASGNLELRALIEMTTADVGNVDIVAEVIYPDGTVTTNSTSANVSDSANVKELTQVLLSFSLTTVSPGDLLLFKFKRNGGTDAHAGDLYLHGLELRYPAVGVGGGGGSGGTSAEAVIIRSYTAGVAVLDAVYQKADGTVDKANADSTATAPAIGFVRQKDFPSAGEVEIVTSGDLSGFAGLSTGETYILSTSPGGIVAESDTGNPNYPNTTGGSGDVLQVIGVAASASKLWANTNPIFEEF